MSVELNPLNLRVADDGAVEDAGSLTLNDPVNCVANWYMAVEDETLALIGGAFALGGHKQRWLQCRRNVATWGDGGETMTSTTMTGTMSLPSTDNDNDENHAVRPPLVPK